MRQVTAYHLHTMDELIAGWRLVELSIGPHSDPIALCVEKPEGRAESGGAAFPKRRDDSPNHFHVCHRISGVTSVVDLPDTLKDYHDVQPLGTDQLLVVRARARSNSDLNAHVYGWDGELVGSFHAGDGIEDVQTTPDGRIWVSYFDEGVFGGLELGPQGAVCLDRSGASLLKFHQLMGPSSGISDCYAMNVASDSEVWLYYYTDFPLVRIRDGHFDREWKGLSVTGARAFAVDGERALFAGNYKRLDGLFLVSLVGIHVEELEPVDADGERIAFVRAFGRGSRLYLATEQDLFTVKLSDC